MSSVGRSQSSVNPGQRFASIHVNRDGYGIVCLLCVSNSCSSSQQTSLVLMALDQLFDVVVVAVEHSTTVIFASLMNE